MDYVRTSVFDSHGKDGTMWVGFDLDGTLAKYDKWRGIDHIGEPIRPMILAAKNIRDSGKKVKIFTARVADKEDRTEAKNHIEKWSEKNLGFVPDITHEKDALMEMCFDDRSIQTFPNTGIPVMLAFSEAMQIISDLTHGFRFCGGRFKEIKRLFELESTLQI